MLDSIKTFFSDRIGSAAGGGPDPLALAGAALMFEVIRADRKVEFKERARLRMLLRREFGLSNADVEQVEELAEREAESGKGVLQFTALVNEHWDLAQRTALVEKLWVLAWADGEIDGLESQTIRNICERLGVSEVDSAAGRKRAEQVPRTPR